MKRTFLPHTRKGWIALALFLDFVLLGIAGNIISTQTNNTIEYPNPMNAPLLGSVIYLAFASAIAASGVAYAALRRDKEPSVLMMLIIPIGAVFFVTILVFLVANLIGSPDA